MCATDMPMTKDHKYIIQRNYHLLVKNMDPKPVVQQLRERGILNDDEVKIIMEGVALDDKVEILLDTLIRCKPDRSFAELTQALLDASQPHVARLLRMDMALQGMEPNCC